MLTSKQRAYLRSLAVDLPEITQVGKGGITDNLIAGLSEALEKRELIKIRTLPNSGLEYRAAAEEAAQKCGADLVAVIGHVFVLYRESEKHKKIILPTK
ncbi:MAG TPA: ribosome assembly RNA-binding protein YhbY [Clostridiales bacterium]|jgi:RNA-binding protein|nr:ribosome assembly RNA-binding protein YhbY [Clostridiales bacterium]